jgi:hypothetical protein
MDQIHHLAKVTVAGSNPVFSSRTGSLDSDGELTARIGRRSSPTRASSVCRRRATHGSVSSRGCETRRRCFSLPSGGDPLLTTPRERGASDLAVFGSGSGNAVIPEYLVGPISRSESGPCRLRAIFDEAAWRGCERSQAAGVVE